EVRILEHLPFGNRVAYDLHRGRLWVVCRSGRRWSLVPLESRWEALEELERLVSKEVRLLSKTDNIAFFRVGPLEIVKVGQADLAEEAWWRYGRQLPDRRWMSRWTPPLLRRIRFGDVAWVGQRSCAECGYPFEDLTFNDRKILLVRPGAELGGAGAIGSDSGAFSLTRRCPKCRSAEKGGLQLTGIEAELVLARVMAFQSDMGESRVTVEAAARLWEDPEGPASLVRVLSRHGRPLGELQPMGLTALEITVNAARERSLLKLEVESLRARWRREEELAALVDGELSPVPLLQLFRPFR
ncbi:MAG: hypothetical protein MUO50_02610, partial [Longimicrobiales bacterium]|nr:hypothetical protein [Longimicrobiales bacterium]